MLLEPFDEDGVEIPGVENLSDLMTSETWEKSPVGKQNAEDEAVRRAQEEQEIRDMADLQKLAEESEVSAHDFRLVIQSRLLGFTTRDLAEQEGVSHTAIIKRIGRAIRRMRYHPGGKEILKKTGVL